jgi:hypothetical protein
MTKKGERTKAAKKSTRRRLSNSVTDLPTGVQKSYFMLSEAERAVLNTALEKYIGPVSLSQFSWAAIKCWNARYG